MSERFADFVRAASDASGEGADGGEGKGGARSAALRASVLGGGAPGRLLAALGLARGAQVTLFSAYGEELRSLREGAGIALRGAGPVGVYRAGEAEGMMRAVGEFDEAARDAELIFLTGPIHKQRIYAMALAEHLRDGQILALAPGRTFGALESAWLLRVGGCRADVALVELQGLPFWMREEGQSLILGEASPIAASVLPRAKVSALDALAAFFPALEGMESVAASGFFDLSAAVEIPALILGGAGLEPGGPKIPRGGVALEENQSFANLIGPEQRDLIGLLAQERRRTAAAFGVRGLPGDEEWISRFSGAPAGEGARPIPDRAHARALMRDGVIGSLAPLASAAKLAGVEIPRTEALIRLVEGLLGADVAAAGRRLDAIGVTARSLDDARRAFDAIAAGASIEAGAGMTRSAQAGTNPPGASAYGARARAMEAEAGAGATAAAGAKAGTGAR